MQGTVYYFDDVAGAWMPQPSAKVNYGTATRWTDASGRFTFDRCPPPGGIVTLTVRSTGPEINQFWDGSSTIAQAYVDNSNCVSEVDVYATNTSAALLYANMVIAAQGTRAIFGGDFARTSPLRVYGSTHNQSDTTGYRSNADSVLITQEYVSGVPGRVAAAHEYGHMIHHKRVGGLYGYGAECKKEHRSGVPSSLGCAWKEGYAEFHAVAVLGSRAGDYATAMQADSAWNFNDASIDEGAVAAFLLDVTDPVGSDQVARRGAFSDGVSLPPAYLLTTIRDCRIRVQGRPADKRIDGVDYLTYCLERLADVSLSQGSWTTECYFAPVPQGGAVGGYAGGTQGTMWSQQCMSYASGQTTQVRRRIDATSRDYYFTYRQPEYPISWSDAGNSFTNYNVWAFLQQGGYAPAVRRLWQCDLFGTCTTPSPRPMFDFTPPPDDQSPDILWHFGAADYNADGRPDLFAMVGGTTGSGTTEPHILSGSSNFQQWAAETSTPLSEGGPEWVYLSGDWDGDGRADLLAVKRTNTGSGSTEVHVLSGASNFQQFVLRTGTPLEETGPDWAFTAADWDGDHRADLLAVRRTGTGSHSTEVHVLSAASNFQHFVLHTGTPLGETGPEWAFTAADWNGDGRADLLAVKKANTNSGSTEVHVLSGASNFQQWALNTGTPLQQTGPEWAFTAADWNGDGRADLLAIARTQTGSHSTEVHMLSGAGNFQQWLLRTGTPLGETW